MSYSHGDAEVDRLLGSYGQVLPILKDAVDNRRLKDRLRCEPLEPLFRVR
jgi:glutamate-1-semialdehyde 2,1-aminomutase